MNQHLRKIVFMAALLLGSGAAFSQGVTTSSMNGKVTDSNGEALPGATVIAVHTPSGTQYGTTTRLDGKYNLNNLRVGGPYKLTITYVGFEPKEIENLFLSLGQNLKQDIDIEETALELSEIQIVASQSDVLNADRTGAATNISNEQLSTLPTLSRGLNDFTRLTPQAASAAGGNGVSFGGQNNRYNQFAIDGIVTNDVFGLAASGTNGGQTGVEPISLDAIEEIQVALAPYDVRQGGFTGATVNAITRSGSNNFEGSVYFFGRDERLVGRSPDEERLEFAEFDNYQTGFRFGGPIIKDKLFYFVNAEVTRESTPLPFAVGTSGSNIDPDELDRVLDKIDEFGYDPGPFGQISDQLTSEKILARIDWNINQDHKFSFRYNYTSAENLNNGRSPNQLRFFNNAVLFPSETHSIAAELNSNFGEISNNLTIGYNRVRDNRTFPGDPFPEVRVDLSNGTNVVFGSEEPSVQNQLDQDIFTITNNLTFYKGDHIITVGTNNEFYSFFNLFLRRNFGEYRYRTLEAFESIGTDAELRPRSFRHYYTPSGIPTDAGAEFNAMQLGLYVQDEWQALPNLKLTGGLRLDVPILPDEPEVNDVFNNSELARANGVSTDQISQNILLLSPRIGFNWDVKEDRTTQVRGGVGIFTGRIPFVWLSNQYTNTGNNILQVDVFNENGLPEDFRFSADPFNQPDIEDLGLTAGASEVNVIEDDFKYPQVLRASLAIDQQLPLGIVGTFEGIYSKTLNNVTFSNINASISDQTVSAIDERPLFESDRIDDRFTNVIVLGNTNDGFTYSFTGQLQKTLNNGLAASVAYTWSRAEDINPGTSSTASSNWQFIENVQGPNNPEQSFADFDVRSRIIASLSYSLQYENNASTTVSLFYNGQSGQPFSYIYDGDLNNDGADNDLVYIPANASEINFTGSPAEQAQQWQALNAYIEGDDYLSERRGQYAERNGARTPWTNIVDLRLMHEFPLNVNDNKNHRLQLSFDVFNLGNLINPEWGRQYSTSFNSFDLMTISENEGERDPEFTYTGGNLNNGDPFFVQDLISRWRGQIGIRYIFD
ncbi:MAG: TonB-dependent receptor [Bacteroidota bacterium]